MTPSEDDHGEEEGGASGNRLLAAASIVRSALEGQRSDKLSLLFEYLLARTLAGATPSENEIASQAFVNERSNADVRDANVRVYVHRLRKLIEAAFSDIEGPRIEIPVGEYRLRLVEDGLPAEPLAWGVVPGSGHSPASVPRLSTRTLIVGAVLVVLALVAAYWHVRDTTPLARTLPWRQLAESGRPIVVVMGDHYLFAEVGEAAADPAEAPRLVWDRTVPTREDLTVYHILNPSAADSVFDFNQQFVSSGTVTALPEIRSALAQLRGHAGKRVQLVASSQLTPEMLMAFDIVYVGHFNGMNVLLRDPLMQASGFRLDSERDGLVDASSGATFHSEATNMVDERIARRDFGYLAAVPGPAGNAILVVAGLGDAGLKEAAKLARDPDRLKALGEGPAKRERGFEALYRVRTIRNVNVGATLVESRPLRSQGIWDRSANVPAYRPVNAAIAPAGESGLPAAPAGRD